MAERVLVVGAGIGGLTCALALAQQGFEVHVLEQSDSIGEIGAGIQLSPNCVRVLHHLGLEECLQRVAFLPDAVEMRNWRTGQVIATNPLGERAVAAYGFPYYHVHRADLMTALVARAHAHHNVSLHTATRFEAFAQTTDGVEVQTDKQHYSGALLIGADGIHSIVRANLFGVEAPRFTGHVAWRALVPTERLPQGLVHPTATLWMGPGKHFVHYYVRAGSLVNCVCVVEKAGWEIESWTQRGERDELERDFAGWHETVRVLIANMAPDACYKWALFDRRPMPAWNQGRVALLGDACHPTLPFMAQGAAMAIEDAAVLAELLSQGANGAAQMRDIAGSLARYASLRRPRTARIQRASRSNARLFHLHGTTAWLRDRVLGTAQGNMLNWVFRYDALTAARR